ncbi:hypothetical protein R3P38DRAFT_1375826 [Favolaschia claudopus]|uniref:Uncharacterized protein n=1 Tax=Favolaschia claudopus TaxID=2862362 RepID=A0AAW0DUS5_9AGAR
MDQLRKASALPHHNSLKHIRVPAEGGEGQAPKLLPAIVWIEKEDQASVGGKMTTDLFCKTYGLGDDIRRRLEKEGLDPVNSLFQLHDAELLKWGFLTGSIAEIKWALKKMLQKEHPHVCIIAPAIRAAKIEGGIGGAGGDGREEGGKGGVGKGPDIDSDLLLLLRAKGGAISGGTGGAGGAGRLRGTNGAGLEGSARDGSRAVTVVQGGALISGGVGGKGGSGREDMAGGKGGAGRGPIIPTLLVGLFTQIKGGIGGEGGDGERVGGEGGDGDGPEVGTLVLSITEETRHKIPTKTLIDDSKNFELNNAPLLKLLKQQGYRTVGGLLECQRRNISVELGFKRGHPNVLKAALVQFCSKYESSKK